MERFKLGIAPIGWTNDDMPDLGADISFAQCISEMSKAGYEGTEIGNKYPKEAKQLKSALASEGLVVANCWHSTFILTQAMVDVEADFREKCAFLKELGAKAIGVSEQSHSIQGTDLAVFYNKYVMNDAEWIILTKGLNYLGEIALEYGISLCYHHHMGTVIQDEAEVDTFMEMTDADKVSLLYDSGHLAYCGADYKKVLEKYIDRVKHIHLKDIRGENVKKVRAEKLSFLQGVRLGTFTVPGDGDIDFAPLFDLIVKSNYSGWLLVEAEQDPAKANPFEYASKGYTYISNILKRYDL